MIRPTILLVSLQCWLLTGCGMLGTADVDSTLDAGQKRIEPVVTALETYRGRHQTYPTSLDMLVSEGLLAEVPKLPEGNGTAEVWPLSYSVAPDGSFYYLRFGYDFPGGIGPGWIITRYFISDVREWRTAKYPPTFDNLVADRFGQVYRKQRSSAALRTVVDRMISSAVIGTNCVNLYQRNVTERLGEGEAVELPADLRRAADVEALKYGTHESDRPSYVFVFQTKTMKVLDEYDSFIEREFHVARAVFEVQPDAKDSSDWKIVTECR